MKEQIIDYLQNYPKGLSPTNLGMCLGYHYNQASARVTRPLQEMVKDKILTKIKSGKNVLYKLK